MNEDTSLWRRHVFQVAVALVAFAIVGALLIVVFRSSRGDGGDINAPQFANAMPACEPSEPIGPRQTTGEIAFVGGDEPTHVDAGADEGPEPPRQFLYLIQPGDAEPRVLTEAFGTDYSLSWSPDGHQLAFVSTDSNAPAHTNPYDETDPQQPPGHVFIVNADGSGLHRLTTNEFAESAPAWSPDGQHIAFMGRLDNRFDPFIANVDGSNVRHVFDAHSDNATIAWSADGRKLAFSIENGIALADGNATSLRRVVDGESPVYSFAWAPDSCRMVYTRDGLHIISLDGSVDEIGGVSSTRAYDPAWTPDGTRILYASSGTVSGSTVMVMNADGSGSRSLAGLPPIKQLPPINSPDGRQIAIAGYNYASDTWELHVANVDGGGVRLVSDLIVPGAVFPAWRPGERPSPQDGATATVPADWTPTATAPAPAPTATNTPVDVPAPTPCHQRQRR